jgi:transposase
MLKDWKDDYRYSYNKAISIIKDDHYSDFDLRNIITPAETCCRITWILRTPKALREGAVFEANKNKKACITNLKNKNIRYFNLRYMSSKNCEWTITGFDNVKKISEKGINLYPRYNFGTIKTVEKVPDNFKSCSIHFDGLYYYILMPVEVKFKNIQNKNPICSIDPGQRTFSTIYDGYNECTYKIGENASNKLYSLMLSLDKLISNISKIKNKKNQKPIKLKINKLKRKIKNLQKEMHDKTNNWLTSNYKQVIIPKFESKKMINKENRKITTKTVRNMTTLGHGLFLEKLKAKAIQNKTTIVVVDEIDTTKTCGKCNNKNNKIKGLSEWKCKICEWEHDRDGNAARNILFKYFRL